MRLDSGDLAALAKRVRAILDDAGLPEVEILASGDLDEYRIAELVAAEAPIDAFGVGTRLGTSHDHPSLGAVYKLVEDADGPRMKLSEGKVTFPGRKQVYRFDDHDVLALASRGRCAGGPPPARAGHGGRPAAAEPAAPALDEIADRCPGRRGRPARRASAPLHPVPPVRGPPLRWAWPPWWPTLGDESALDGTSASGVFGGTFDPPHVGHLVIAVNVRYDLDLDRVLLVVANDPWQKIGSREVSKADDRLAMCEAAVGDVDGLEVSDLEVRRGGVSYTADTLAELRRRRIPSASCSSSSGSDAAAGLPDLGSGRRGARAGHDRRRHPSRRRSTGSRRRAGTGSGSRRRASKCRAPTSGPGSPTGGPLDYLLTPPVIASIEARGLYR